MAIYCVEPSLEGISFNLLIYIDDIKVYDNILGDRI